MAEKRLSRELSPEEVVRETKGVDESLPEAPTVHRRLLATERATGAAEHRAGDEEEPEDEPRREPAPEPADPPRRYDEREGS